MMTRTTPAAQVIIDQLETEPPNNVDPHPRLFDDLEDDKTSDALFKLWRKGIVDAEWDEDGEGTDWRLSHFGVELHEKGLAWAYIHATENEIELDVQPSLLVYREEVA